MKQKLDAMSHVSLMDASLDQLKEVRDTLVRNLDSIGEIFVESDEKIICTRSVECCFVF